MKTMLIFAAFAAVLGATPALAREPTAAPSRAVRVSDLDLGTPRGQTTLDRRVAQAVRSVCGSASDANLRGRNDVRQCRERTAALVDLKRDVATASVAPRD